MSSLRPKSSVKAMKQLRETIPEQYIGFLFKMESDFSACCLKEVAEKQNFCTEPSRNW